jgi:hypothetical protein
MTAPTGTTRLRVFDVVKEGGIQYYVLFGGNAWDRLSSKVYAGWRLRDLSQVKMTDMLLFFTRGGPPRGNWY